MVLREPPRWSPFVRASTRRGTPARLSTRSSPRILQAPASDLTKSERLPPSFDPENIQLLEPLAMGRIPLYDGRRVQVRTLALQSRLHARDWLLWCLIAVPSLPFASSLTSAAHFRVAISSITSILCLSRGRTKCVPLPCRDRICQSFGLHAPWSLASSWKCSFVSSNFAIIFDRALASWDLDPAASMNFRSTCFQHAACTASGHFGNSAGRQRAPP